jgi:hypothetical protein
VKFIPLYVLSALFLTSGIGVNQNHNSKSIDWVSPASSRNAWDVPPLSLFHDTLLIPDDTIPPIILPAGTIQVMTEKSQNFRSRIKILGCGNYNQPSSVSLKSAKLKWKGLFEVNDGFYIADTKLKLKRWHSELDNEANEKTGWLVGCNNKDRNIILINGDAHLVNGIVKKALPLTKLYYAGQKIEFEYYGAKYTLYTTGFKRNGKIYNYKLFLLAKVKDHYINQLIKSLPPGVSFGGDGDMSTSIDIEFTGDLDGDKIPDFIISESGYSFGFSFLYLSKSAGKTAILKLVSQNGDTD